MGSLMKIRKSNSGFTLIELMITLAIVGILLTISVSSYREWIENTKIRTVASSVQGGLQLARAEAVKRNMGVQFNFRTGSAWTVCLRPATPSNCPMPDTVNTIQSKSETEGSSSTVTVETLPANINRVVFNNLGQVDAAVSFTGVNVDNTAISPAESKNLRVTIGVGGNTRMCDPAFNYATDPKGC